MSLWEGPHLRYTAANLSFELNPLQSVDDARFTQPHLAPLGLIGLWGWVRLCAQVKTAITTDGSMDHQLHELFSYKPVSDIIMFCPCNGGAQKSLIGCV